MASYESGDIDPNEVRQHINSLLAGLFDVPHASHPPRNYEPDHLRKLTKEQLGLLAERLRAMISDQSAYDAHNTQVCINRINTVLGETT